MIVIHRKLLLKVSSDTAAVPKAINVLAIWCWVWVSHFLLLDLITLLYVNFCFLYLLFINSSKNLPQWNQFWNILWKHDFVSCSYQVWCWHHVLFTYSELFLWVVTMVLYFSDMSPYCILYIHVKIESCGKLFVACNKTSMKESSFW